MLSDNDDEYIPEKPDRKKSLICDSFSSDEDFDQDVPPTSDHFSSSSNTPQVLIQIKSTSNGTVANKPANLKRHSATTSNKLKRKQIQEKMATLSWNESMPPSDDIKSSINYFRQFFDDNL